MFLSRYTKEIPFFEAKEGILDGNLFSQNGIQKSKGLEL